MNIKAKMPNLSIVDLCDVQPTTNVGHSLPFVYWVTSDKPAERKQDTSWNHCHEFHRGYFWLRSSDGAMVFNYILNRLGIKFQDFPNLPSSKIEEIVKRINEDEEKDRKFKEENPTSIEFNTFSFPKFSDSELNLIRNSKGPSISETFSSTYLDDLGNQDVKES